jgi:predicted small secreted protein
MSHYLKIAGVLMLPVLLSACNTIEGFAKDIQLGGTAIENGINGKKAEEKKAEAEKPKALVTKKKAKVKSKPVVETENTTGY